jgi:hypothetical protein
MYDRATDDEELVTLVELKGPENKWNTNDFLSTIGYPIKNDNNGRKNDGTLQALPGHRITAEYVDNITLTESVLLPSEVDTTISIYLGGAPYVAEVAPNPFYESKYDNFRLRVASAAGSLTIRKLEVYDLSGEKVREISASSLHFDTGSIVPKERYGIVEHWWDLCTDNGQKAASGTYWLKVHADLVYEDTGVVETVGFIKKFVIVR